MKNLRSEIENILDDYANYSLQEASGELLRLFSEYVSGMDKMTNKDYSNGWSGYESGKCCKKCRMTNPTNPLHVLVGCKDPFQINCKCHIPHRKGYQKGWNYALETLKAELKKLME